MSSIIQDFLRSLLSTTTTMEDDITTAADLPHYISDNLVNNCNGESVTDFDDRYKDDVFECDMRA